MNTNNSPSLITSLTNKNDDFFQCLDEAGLAARPRPTFAIEGFVPAAKTTILCGQTYTGKSIIALDMALCISAGVEWNGLPTQEGLAFYITGEWLSGLKKRIAAWREHTGLDHPEHFFLLGQAVPLDDERQIRRLIATIKHQVQRTGAPARLVVFDSLNNCLDNANPSTEMPRVLKAAESICQATGAAVLLVHGVNHHGELRGSGVMLGDPAELLLLEGQSGSEVVRLRATKECEFDVDEMTLRRKLVTMEEMPDQYGEPSTGVVFVRDDSATMPGNKGGKQKRLAQPDNGDTLSDKETVTLRALHQLCASRAESAIFTEWREAAKKLGVSPASFSRAKKKLVELRLVTVGQPGKLGARYAPAPASASPDSA